MKVDKRKRNTRGGSFDSTFEEKREDEGEEKGFDPQSD
jgi:hypothetical protein